MRDFNIPLVDMSAFYSQDATAKVRVAREIGRACENTGFLVITGHCVPTDLVQTLRSQARAYFDLPVEHKRRALPANPQTFRGYAPMSEESLAALSASDSKSAPPDLKECFDMGQYRLEPSMVDPGLRGFYPANIWTGVPASLRSTCERYFDALEQLCKDILSLLALALDAPEHFFTDFDRNHLGASALRLIHYPPLPPRLIEGQIRGGAHTDYSTITACSIDDAAGGLEVLAPDGQWRPVPYIPGSFVINLGDCMARWSNDRWVSTFHRVANPPAAAAAATPTDRLSLIFFHGVRPDALIECLPNCAGSGRPPKYPPIRYIDFLTERIGTQTRVPAN